jgi:hypothetical protein
MQTFSIEYKVNERGIFIDSSKRSLKTVLLHNGKNYASLPTSHSVHLKESYENLELVLTKRGYTDHDWMICGGLKVLCMLLGQQAGYTKYPYFMYKWDSRARSQHWEQNIGTSRTSLEPGSKNILRRSLFDPTKILLPPLHIKLGIMKQFARALPKTGNCFMYHCKKFPHLLEAKLKADVFVGPDIRKLMFDEHFFLTITEVEREAWMAFKSVTKFLGNSKDPITLLFLHIC